MIFHSFKGINSFREKGREKVIIFNGLNKSIDKNSIKI